METEYKQENGQCHFTHKCSEGKKLIKKRKVLDREGDEKGQILG